MENYVEAGKIHLKYHLKYHLLAGLLLLCLMPFLTGVQYLEPNETAQTLEMYAALMGIIFLVPAFLPEQDRNIRDLLRSKKVSITCLHIIRILEALVFLALFTGACVVFLKYNGCEFPMWGYYLGTLAGALFLGGLGMFFYSLTDNIAVGYMIPIVYYVTNFSGDKYLKNFYLFSMMGGSYVPKFYLAAAGTLLLLAGVVWRRFKP